MHVFAVSGLHVGLIAAVMTGTLLLLQVPRRWCGLVGIPLLVLYVFATGARPSAVRALVMVSVFLGGWAFVRPVDGLNSLAAAALGILLFDPAQLFDGGFQLSVGAVAALMLLAGGTNERLRGWLAPDPFIPLRLVPWWRRALADGWKQVAKFLACSWAAWIGLLPMMAWYFNLFTPIGVLTNLVVVPLLGIIIGLGLLSTAAFTFWPWLALTFNNTNFLLLSLMMEVVGWLEQIPFGHLFVQAPPIWLMAVYYVALLAWAGRRWWWPARKWVALACAPALLGGVFVTAKVDDVVAVTVLQVDEGAAIFVNLPGERADWLIDGGGQDGRRELVPFLRSQGVDRLAGLIVSCKDKVHVTGLHRVITEMPVKELILSDTSARSNPYWRWRGIAQSAGLATRHVRAGDTWSVRGVRFTVLSPPVDTTTDRADDNALVLLLEYGATRLLLMSSAGASTEERLLQHNPDLRADIIIKGSHGKEPTGTAEFLAATRPQHVIQNVGAWSRHRPIDSALFERVENSGAKLWRTDETGAVTVQLTARGYKIRPHR
jgi:competence protein ComEC